MKRVVTVTLIVLTAATGLSGCLRERICLKGEEQVRSIEYPDEGIACTEDGAVPSGFETYPPGEQPTEVYIDELEGS